MSNAETLEIYGGQGDVKDFVGLLKPRVMSLVVFTAIVGLLAAPGHIHPWMGFMAILCIAVGAGASGALNMWYDADIDAVMKRTASRPVPSGRVTPHEALGFGLVLSVASVLLLGLFTNVAAAALLAFTIFFYAVVYTMAEAPHRAEHRHRRCGRRVPTHGRLGCCHWHI
jgi:heme o synthase